MERFERLPASGSASRGMIATRKRLGSTDAVFRITVTIAGCLMLLLIAGMVFFLLTEAMPAIRHYGFLSFLSSTRWAPSEANPLRTTPNPYGIVQFIYGTLLTSAVAMIIAVPLSVAVALFITDVAPRALRRPLSSLVDLLERASLRPRVSRWVIDSVGSSAHYAGTCRMHSSPRLGMLDVWSRLHAVPNVVVADSAAFTTHPEKNPVLTAMALAARASQRLADDLRAGRV